MDLVQVRGHDLLGQFMRLSTVGNHWMRIPLKNHGVFDDTYDGWYAQLSKL